MESHRRGLVIFLLVVIGLFGASASFSLGFGLGLWQARQSEPPVDFFSGSQAASATPLDTDLFWQVWHEVQKSYVDQPVTDSSLFYGAIAGLAAAVDDPYTMYLNPEETKKLDDVLYGQFEGIGAEIGAKDGQIVVIAPLAGTPAEAAGLLPDDIIIKIDGVDTTGMSVDEAITLIRGPKNTTVTLTVYRSGDIDFREFTIVRDTIELETVKYEEIERDGQTIGVITLAYVDRGASEVFSEITHQILLNMPDGLILDMRNNPGGLLDEAIAITSSFVEDGLVVQEQLGDGQIKEYPALGSADLATSPKLVVLINEGSASAAEIIAGALQDHQRATLVGQTTFGKGSVQGVRSFPDGSSLKITEARWLTPQGRTIDHVGMEPDVVVEFSFEQYEQGVDTQLEAAIDEFINP